MTLDWRSTFGHVLPVQKLELTVQKLEPTNLPFIAFEHLSLKRIQASLWHYVAFSGKVNHGRPRYSQVQPGTVRYSQVQPGTVLKRPIMSDLFLEKQVGKNLAVCPSLTPRFVLYKQN